MGKGSMKKPKSLIYKLIEFADKFIQLVPTLDNHPNGIVDLPATWLDDASTREMMKRGAYYHFTFLISSLKKGNKQKATKHAAKLKSCLRVTHNDDPFSKGDKVWVTRTEHGWEPGWTARINEVHTHTNGVHSYSATVFEDHNGQCEPFTIHIDHTRDASLC